MTGKRKIPTPVKSSPYGKLHFAALGRLRLVSGSTAQLKSICLFAVPLNALNTERKITAVPNGKRGAERYCICQDYCNRNVCSCQRVLSKKCSCSEKFFENPAQDVRRVFRFLRIASKSGVYTHTENFARHSVTEFWNSKQIRCGHTSDFCPLSSEGQQANPVSTHLLLSWDSHTLLILPLTKRPLVFSRGSQCSGGLLFDIWGDDKRNLCMSICSS